MCCGRHASLPAIVVPELLPVDAFDPLELPFADPLELTEPLEPLLPEVEPLDEAPTDPLEDAFVVPPPEEAVPTVPDEDCPPDEELAPTLSRKPVPWGAELQLSAPESVAAVTHKPSRGFLMAGSQKSRSSLRSHWLAQT